MNQIEAMANYKIRFGGQFENKILESRFLHSVKPEIVYQNKISILVTGIGFLVVAIADFLKLGYTVNFQIALIARVLFFLMCGFIYIQFKPTINFKKFVFFSFSFALITCATLLFLIYILNPDLQLDNIDKVVLPFCILMIFILLHLKPTYLIINAVISSVFYILLISIVFVTSIDFIINISVVLCVIIIGGLLLMRVSRISQRKQFLQSFQIKSLNDNLRDEMDERIAIQDKLQYSLNELSNSITYAKNLQMTFMPSENILENISKDYFILFKPRDEVSGDFYWVNNSETETIIAIADCTGHGMPGALMSILGISLLNKIIKDFRKRDEKYSAGDILNNLRLDLISSVKSKQDDFKSVDGMDISICIINKQNHILQFSGAYHKLWLIRVEENSPKMIIFKGDNMPIGSHSNIFNSFTNHSISLKSNDSIILTTDGFQDQFGGENLKRFKSKKLKELLLSINNRPMSEQKNILKKVFNDWKGENEQIDDVLTVGIRFTFPEINE